MPELRWLGTEEKGEAEGNSIRHMDQSFHIISLIRVFMQSVIHTSYDKNLLIYFYLWLILHKDYSQVCLTFACTNGALFNMHWALGGTERKKRRTFFKRVRS